ncbi:MAG: class I adenylate-forming enzyme family protein, partial [Candidatus Limivicinus sp.]
MRFDSFEQMLSHLAETAPDAPALRYEEKTLSFSELKQAVDARAATLRAEGKTCLGLLCDGSLDCVVEIFAASLAGLQLVMLNASLDTGTLRTLVRYTDVDTLWGEEDLKEDLELALMEGVKNGAGKILFFTSGTTEQAKAVVLTDYSLCQSAWNGSAKLPLSPADNLLCLLPLDHVFGFVCGLLWGLSCGACVSLGRGARHYLDDCDFYRPTAVSVVPMLLGFLLKQNCLNPELGLVLVGAGDCPRDLLEL